MSSKDKLNEREDSDCKKENDASINTSELSSSAKRVRKFRAHQTEDEKMQERAKDRERKRSTALSKKGPKPKPKCTPNRSTKSVLKRKLAQNEWHHEKRQKMTTEEKSAYNLKDKLRKHVLHNNTDTIDSPSLDATVNKPGSETDRTYLSNIARKVNLNLKNYQVTNLSQLFAKMISNIKWHQCGSCHTKMIGLKSKCFCYKKESLLNTELMHIGEVPPELSCLSTIEQLLISRVHPVVQVYRLRGGQLGYNGHVINFFQDIQTFVNVLPHTIEDISGIVKVCCKTKSFHKDFSIRKGVVLDALNWLKLHNTYYSDITIDIQVLSNLPEQFEATISDDLTPDPDNELTNENKQDLTDNCNIESSSYPQSNMISPEEKIRHNLKWPDIGKEPISELDKTHYIVMAFPTLFPYGKGDISAVVNNKFTSRDYFQYLMNYKDNRFALHKIFPYFAWNSVMRWECLTKGTVYMKRHPDMKKVNVELLKALMQSKPNIGKDVMVYSSNIRSTRNFWYTRSSELQDMVHQIDLPTIFFTLSAADFHWPQLYDILKEVHGCKEISETERHNLMFDNPKICSDYFFEVVEIFINQILIAHFHVKDHWYRFEWQLRGSPHVHGVFWFAGAVNVHELQHKLNEVKQKVIEYFEQFISCTNPNTNYVITPNHPCRIRIQDVVDYEEDLAGLVNTVQRHTVCSTKTCLKLNKKGELICKHHFPKVLRETSDLVLSDRKYLEFEGKRNDDRLNKFNEFITVNWRANHDITAILSAGGFSHYIAKYATKSEVKSNLLNNLFLKVLDKSPGKTSVKSAVQRTLMSALIERDYSAQEVHHLLSGHKLYSCSRSFITLNLSVTEWFHHIKLSCNEDSNFSDNCNQLLNSYSNRPAHLTKIKLLDFLRLYNHKTYERKRGRPAILRVFPRLDLSMSANPDSNPAVDRQLCILFCPWTKFEELPSSDTEWTNMKLKNKLKYEFLPYYKSTEEINVETDLDVNSTEEINEGKTQEDWMELCGENEPNEISDLGNREIDHSFDWKGNQISNEDEMYYSNFIKSHKQNFVKPVAMIPPYVNFNSEQNEVINFVDSLIEFYNNNGNFGDLPKFLVCQASAGCGKTMVIQGIVHLITEKCGDDMVCIIAPTAAAAVNAGGRTIHSNMRVYVGRDKKNVDLAGETLHNFQQEMKNVHFIIIDEFSMVGCRMFSIINRRCMQMKNSSEFFGGCVLLMFGDVKQLQPVGDESLCRRNSFGLKAESIDGYNLFKCVDTVKVLKTCHRQSDVQFLKFLQALSHGEVSEEDKLYIKGRFEEYLSDSDALNFKHAIHLYMTRAGVYKFNNDTIREMNIPILKITAENNCAVAAACTDEVACNLQQNLHVGIGVRVMLRANLWTDAGLVNGAFGTISKIIFFKGNNTLVPNYILIQFDNYTGPVTSDGSVPIPRILRSWYFRDQYCTRIQFPIDIGYATTYHKSQGLTIPKVVVHVDSKEKQAGMYYVAISRVKNPEDLMISGGFENSPLFHINRESYRERNQNEKWLLSKTDFVQF